jgi:Tfp pilus assembly major pilin PilA
MKTKHTSSRGLTLVEAMFLMVIMSIVAVGAGIGLQSVAKVPTATDLVLATDNAILSTIEQWKSKPWASQVSQSDTVTVNNKSLARTITVANADPSNPESGTNTQTDFHRITVQIGTRSMRVYVINP